MTRQEYDLLGVVEVPEDAWWGAHTERARRNFPATLRRQPPALIRALARVKAAAARTNGELGVWPAPITEALLAVAEEMADGDLDAQLVVDPLAGGAGTSLNMNVNEVLANRANERLGGRRGDYRPVHPLDTVNRHQSTNDVYPTAVRIAAMWELSRLESSLIALQQVLQAGEHRWAEVVMTGRTQLQDALPVTAGQVFGAWAEACARDRWRVFKCVERLKTVNLGGTAVGTGVGAPRKYIFRVIEHLRDMTGLPLSRAENPVEATGNQDALVETSGILSALAVNLLKLAQDLRLLSMPAVGEFHLPAAQAGSSIMPGKVNPVLAEHAAQAALAVLAGHGAISSALGLGNLQLSQYLPLAAWHLLDNLDLLAGACHGLAGHCLAGVSVDTEQCRAHLAESLAVAAALVPVLGYGVVEAAVRRAREAGVPLTQALGEAGASPAQLAECLAPARLRRLGDG